MLQESLEDLERRIELEEKLAAVRAKRAEAETQLAAAAEKVAAAKLTEARAKVIAGCAADSLVSISGGDVEGWTVDLMLIKVIFLSIFPYLLLSSSQLIHREGRTFTRAKPSFRVRLQ